MRGGSLSSCHKSLPGCSASSFGTWGCLLLGPAYPSAPPNPPWATRYPRSAQQPLLSRSTRKHIHNTVYCGREASVQAAWPRYMPHALCNYTHTFPLPTFCRCTASATRSPPPSAPCRSPGSLGLRTAARRACCRCWTASGAGSTQRCCRPPSGECYNSDGLGFCPPWACAVLAVAVPYKGLGDSGQDKSKQRKKTSASCY